MIGQMPTLRWRMSSKSTALSIPHFNTNVVGLGLVRIYITLFVDHETASTELETEGNPFDVSRRRLEMIASSKS